MKSISLLLMIIGLLQAKLFATNSDPIVSSKLQSAIVYRNSAELIHLARAGLHQGNNELIIGDISNNVDVNSIKIGCSGIVTIMSIAFSKEWLKPEFKSASYKKMEDSINAVKKDISKLTILMVSDHELIDLLKANREIKGDATGLNVAELAKLVDYYKQKSLELQNELNDCKEKVTKLNGILESLQKQLLEEERKNTKTSGRLALQLLSPTEGIFDFTISYLTPTAYWNPYYDFRVDNINQPLAISYKAKLVQSSGIDWKQVKLTLSTAVPSQNNNAPQLKTWFLTYIDPVAQMNHELRKKAIPSMEGRPVSSQLNDVVVSGYGPRTKDKSTPDNNEINDPLYIVNGRQMSVAEFGKIDQRAIKKMESLKGANATAMYGSAASNGAVIVTLKDELGDYVSINDNELNITFDIDIPYDVKSDGKEQNVVLKEYHIPVAFDYYAVPKLDGNAYLLAEVPGWEKLNLLPGEANIIFEGTYVGKSYIDPNSTLDSLNLTMGRDKRVVIKKEKLKDFGSVKFLGSDKKQVFAYEITVKNNKKEKVTLKLADQFPISSNKDIEVDLLESSGAIVNNETGELTWKMELSPGETKKFRISYSIKFPKDRIVNVN